MSEIIIEDAGLRAVMDDPKLADARRKLSFHEIRLIMQHARKSITERAAHYETVITELSEARNSAVIGEIAAERARQISDEGWTPAHDDDHTNGELAKAAACYALRTRHVTYQLRGGVAGVRGSEDWYYDRLPAWPWDADRWKPGTDRRRQLVKAAALVVAEIERLDRVSPK